MKKNLLLLLIFLSLSTTLKAQWEYVAFDKHYVQGVGFVNDVIYTNVIFKGINYSLDYGKNFTPFEQYQDPLTDCFMKFNDDLFYNGSWLYKTTDTGKTVKDIGVYYSLSTPFIYSIASKDSFFFAGANTVYRTTTPNTNDWPNILPPGFSGEIYHMMFYNDTLFVAQFVGRIVFSGNLGNTWDSCKTRISGEKFGGLMQIAINNKYIFAASEIFGIFRSSDRGQTWQEVGAELINDTALTIIAKNNYVVAGTINGVFFSSDNGDTWTERNYGLDSLEILNLYFHNDEIWAATNSGIYKIRMDEIFTSVAKDTRANISSSLSPNPATDYIEIVLSDRTLKDAVKVYDVLGVEVLSASYTPPDPLSRGGNVRIDVSTLPAGVYFVRVGDEIYKFVKM